VPVIKNYETDL